MEVSIDVSTIEIVKYLPISIYVKLIIMSDLSTNV